MNRERLPIEPRRVSAGTRAKILAATDHVCARPNCPDRATDVDHILPLWLGGSNREKNLEGLCPSHHAAKTKAEASLRAKAKRREARDTGTRRARKPIPQRVNAWPPKGTRKLGGYPPKADEPKPRASLSPIETGKADD